MPAKKHRVPAAVFFSADRDLEPILSPLVSLLGESIHSQFGDTVLSLRPRTREAGGESLAAQSFQIESLNERCGTVDFKVPEQPHHAAEFILQALREYAGKYTFIFLDPSGLKNDCVSILIDQIANKSNTIGLTLRHIGFTRKKTISNLPAAFSGLRIDILEPLKPDEPKSLRNRAASIAGSVSPHGRRFFRNLKEARGSYYPSSRSAEWCRIRLDVDQLNQYQNGHPSGSISLAQLPADMRESMGRAARALSDRRVGLALGGSGAWGYAHIALIEDLLNEGIPIDLIAGSSSGALLGAYYCALGREGLRRAVNRGPLFSRLVLLSTLSSATIECLVDLDLGRRPLDSLEVVLLPVATNLKEGRPEVIQDNTIGFGVRASSSAPGIFTPTPAQDALYVDGAVTDNVPLLLVERMGADLSIASNPLPPPLNRNIKIPKTPIESLFQDLNPIARATDFLASFSLMFHDAGQHEPKDNRIIFEPPAAELPLLGTFEFNRAKEIIRTVREQRAYKETLRRAKQAWEKMQKPRDGRGEP